MKSKGFTVLEVITAIFILTVGVGAALSLINQSLATGSVVEQTLIASYLAQEGIEIVRNIRDSTWLDDSSLEWYNYLPAGDYEIDYSDTDLNGHTYNPANPKYLNIESVIGFYGYGVADPQAQTKFIRVINIDHNQLPTKIKVTAEVRWEERGRIHTFTALEHITNWYE